MNDRIYANVDSERLQNFLDKVRITLTEKKESEKFHFSRHSTYFGLDIKIMYKKPMINGDKLLMRIETNLKENRVSLYKEDYHIATLYKNNTQATADFITFIKRECREIEKMLDEFIKELDDINKEEKVPEPKVKVKKKFFWNK
ncbi:MAG: hypothetical protein M0R46_11670 [Candidatus Muirbacterium halophilum]|nr:hypothetical protein [Candidatus Muirbacterium halophilum]